MAPSLGRRRVTVPARRTAVACARSGRARLEAGCPDAAGIVLVTDRLTPHVPAALDHAFPPAAARRLLERIAGHHPPTHAAWPTPAARESAALQTQCLDRRLPDRAMRERAPAAGVAARNAAGRAIAWTRTVAEAPTRRHRLSPPLA